MEICLLSRLLQNHGNRFGKLKCYLGVETGLVNGVLYGHAGRSGR